MEDKADKNWTPIHALIEAEKEDAWKKAEGMIIRADAARNKKSRTAHFRPAWALGMLILLAGLITLLRLPRTSVRMPFTANMLPLFHTTQAVSSNRPREHWSSALDRPLSLLLEQVNEKEWSPPSYKPEQETGNAAQARKEIQRVIRERSLERFLSRFSAIKEEEQS